MRKEKNDEEGLMWCGRRKRKALGSLEELSVCDVGTKQLVHDTFAVDSGH